VGNTANSFDSRPNTVPGIDANSRVSLGNISTAYPNNSSYTVPYIVPNSNSESDDMKAPRPLSILKLSEIEEVGVHSKRYVMEDYNNKM